MLQGNSDPGAVVLGFVVGTEKALSSFLDAAVRSAVGVSSVCM